MTPAEDAARQLTALRASSWLVGARACADEFPGGGRGGYSYVYPTRHSHEQMARRRPSATSVRGHAPSLFPLSQANPDPAETARASVSHSADFITRIVPFRMGPPQPRTRPSPRVSDGPYKWGECALRGTATSAQSGTSSTPSAVAIISACPLSQQGGQAQPRGTSILQYTY